MLQSDADRQRRSELLIAGALRAGDEVLLRAVVRAITDHRLFISVRLDVPWQEIGWQQVVVPPRSIVLPEKKMIV